MLRKKRYLPDPRLKDTPWVYTDQDQEILVYLMRYRYLRGRYIAALVGRLPNSVNRNLKKLHAKGLVGKPRSQFLGWNSLNDSDIYEILPKGIERLKEHVPEATNLIRAKTDAPTRQFAHAMMICDALSSIEIGVKKAGYTFITEAEIIGTSLVDDPLRLPCSLAYTFRNGRKESRTTYARPDAIFGVKYPNGKTRLFVLEAEHYSPVYRNTFENTSTLKKVLSYLDIKKNGVMLKHLGKRRFSVLFVFPHVAEKDEQDIGFRGNARRVIEEVCGSSDLFLLKSIPVQEELLGSPSPFPELMFNEPWERGGMEPESIKEAPST